MKKLISLALCSLLMITLISSQEVHADEVGNDFSYPLVRVERHIPATVYKTYDPGVTVPSRIYVARVVEGFTYTGYLEKVKLVRTNTGRADVTYSGFIHLN